MPIFRSEIGDGSSVPGTREHGSDPLSKDHDFFVESNMLRLKGASRVDIGAVFPAQASRIGMPKAGAPVQKWVSPSLAKKGKAVGGSLPSGLRVADRSDTGLAKKSSKRVRSVVIFREGGSLADSAVAELQVSVTSSKPFRKRVLVAFTNADNGDLLPLYQKRNNPLVRLFKVRFEPGFPDLVNGKIEIMLEGFADSVSATVIFGKDGALMVTSGASFTMGSNRASYVAKDTDAINASADIADAIDAASRWGSTFAGAALSGRQSPGLIGGNFTQVSRIETPDLDDVTPTVANQFAGKESSKEKEAIGKVVEFGPDPVVGVGNGSGRCKASGSVIARMDGAGIVLFRRLGGVPIHFPVIYPFGIVLVIVLPPRSSILILVIVIRSESLSARWVGGILLCLDLYCYVVPDCQWKGSGHAGLEVSL